MADPNSFELTTEDVGDTVRIVSLRGEADRFKADEVSKALEDVRGSGRHAIVDLSAVVYLDSSMLSALVAASEQGRRRSRPLVILCETPRLRRSLQLKGLETILLLAETREQALELAAGEAAPG
jgi:anti-sigma B factor antagonist